MSLRQRHKSWSDFSLTMNPLPFHPYPGQCAVRPDGAVRHDARSRRVQGGLSHADEQGQGETREEFVEAVQDQQGMDIGAIDHEDDDDLRQLMSVRTEGCER